jgi:small-conductance mechanosensitive channel
MQKTQVRRTFGVASVLILFMLGLGACADSTSNLPSSIRDRLPGQTKADQETQPKDGSTQQDQEVQKPRSFPIRPLDVRTYEARELLAERYDNFWRRDPIGVSMETLDVVRDRVRAIYQRAKQLRDRARAMSFEELLDPTIPGLIFGVFLALFFVLTRQFRDLADRLQSGLHLEMSRWVTRLSRGAILILGRVLPVAVLLVASYIPVQITVGEAVWTEILTRSLWLLLLYRFIAGAIVVSLSGRLLEMTDSQANRLEKLGLRAARTVFGFLIVLVALRTGGASEAIIDLVEFIFRVVLVTFPLYLLFIKDALVPLLPDDVDSRPYDAVRRLLVSNYRLLMVATAIILGLRAVGFAHASTFLLSRTYGIIGLVLFSFVGGARIRDYFRRRVDFLSPHTDPSDKPLDQTDHRQLTRRIDQLLAAAVFVFVIVGVLELLKILEPTVVLLRIPFLAIGTAHISFLNILNLLLVILGTILAFRVLRSFLNARIYPMLEVDVGVAYAVNTIVKYVIILVAFLLSLSALGINLTAITVVLASLGVGIGFGLQTLVENLISGFIILFGRSVQKGDYITVSDTYGQVEAVGARSVVIRTPDNYEMLIPSKEIVGGQIINWSYEDNTVRARLPVGVTYNADPREVKPILEKATRQHPKVLEEPEPRVILSEFGDSSINFEVLFYFDCRETTRQMIVGEINFDIWDALADADIEIPFPQRDLHLRSVEQWGRLAEIAEKAQEAGEDKELPETIDVGEEDEE